MSLIEFKQVHFSYRGQKKAALNGLSFNIEQGDFFGLLGPNGSGKSTSIALLCGLLKPKLGKVILFDKTYAFGKSSIQKQLGLVPQAIALYKDLSLMANLKLFGKLYGLSGKLLKQRIAYALEVADLVDSSNERVANFSGGMMRRANIVTAILHQPKVLVLDEPTVGVDPQSRNKIFACLKQLNQEGMSILYTSHYMEEVEELCNKIAIMDAGKIIKSGSLAELVKGHKNLGQVFLQLTGCEVRD